MADYGPPGNPLQQPRSALQPPAVRPGITVDLDLGKLLQEVERPDLDGRMVGVASSMVEAVGYNLRSQELTVLFVSGREYTYRGVPVEVYDGLLAAPSVGQFMRQNVIDQFSF